MRISNYLKEELKKALNVSFKNCKLVLFGSRVDDNKKGGDFDLAIVGEINEEEFKKGKRKFFKYLILKDLDLPIDLIFYKKANDLLKQEIKKGVIL